MSQIGRIGGQVLTDNLLRAGVDLAFENDLLYLDVTNRRIGIKDATPSYELDVNSSIGTTDLSVDTLASPGNLRLSGNTISTLVGGIAVFVAGSDLFHDRLITTSLVFDDNKISSLSNANIVFDPNGSGIVDIKASTDITGDLSVSGNINMAGDLTGISNIILGDQTIDTVTVNTDFTQSIVPGDDLTYALGADAADSSVRRWAQIHSPDWTNIINSAGWAGSGIRPLSVNVSEQLRLDGVINKISGIQSNEDVLLNPNSGITYIERTKWENNDITNLNNTPITFASTGIGYTRFMDTNAMVIPAGTDAERRGTPEVGETRWNTDQQYLECFDGTVWAVSIGGGGGTITVADMDDLGNVYTLMLG